MRCVGIPEENMRTNLCTGKRHHQQTGDATSVRAASPGSAFIIHFGISPEQFFLVNGSPFGISRHTLDPVKFMNDEIIVVSTPSPGP